MDSWLDSSSSVVLRVIGLPGLLLAKSLGLWCLFLGFFFLGAPKRRKGEGATSSVKTSFDNEELLSAREEC